MYLFFRFVCKNVAKVLFAFERAHLRLLFFTLIPGIKVKVFTKKIHFFFCESTLIFLRNDSFQEVQNAHGDLRNRDQGETGEETDVTEYHADEDEKIENR